MTSPIDITLTTTHNSLFTPDSICEHCAAPAEFFLDAHAIDEYAAALCAAHAAYNLTAMILESSTES